MTRVVLEGGARTDERARPYRFVPLRWPPARRWAAVGPATTVVLAQFGVNVTLRLLDSRDCAGRNYPAFAGCRQQGLGCKMSVVLASVPGCRGFCERSDRPQGGLKGPHPPRATRGNVRVLGARSCRSDRPRPRRGSPDAHCKLLEADATASSRDDGHRGLQRPAGGLQRSHGTDGRERDSRLLVDVDRSGPGRGRDGNAGCGCHQAGRRRNGHGGGRLGERSKGVPLRQGDAARACRLQDQAEVRQPHGLQGRGRPQLGAGQARPGSRGHRQQQGGR